MEYFPIIVVILFIGSFFVIYARGGFNEKKNLAAPSLSATPTPSPSLIPTSASTSTPNPTSASNLIQVLLPTDTPVPLGTIPSINRRGGDDD